MHHQLDFQHPLPEHWHKTQIGAGEVIQSGSGLCLTIPQTQANTPQYHDAQLTDYARRHDFVWRPPLHMEVVARYTVSNITAQPLPLVGTAGFGFWNHPYGFKGERLPRLPKAVWFFFSAPPSNMQLARAVAGPGWKAATIDTTRWQFLALAPTAPVSMLLMRFPALYRRLWPIGQQAIGVSEYLLDSNLLMERHSYSLDWQSDRVRFGIDGATIHEAQVAIKGPMGFIAWIDNQFAVVTPQGQLGFGLVDVPQTQSLILEHVEISGDLS